MSYLVLATIFTFVGLFCMIGAVALGFTWGNLIDMVDEGKFSVHTGESSVVEVGESGGDVAELGTCSKLDIELDAGTGAGQLYLELVGTEEDYDYAVECGIGEINIGSVSYGGLGREQRIMNPGAERFMDIECGIGSIQMEFAGNPL